MSKKTVSVIKAVIIHNERLKMSIQVDAVPLFISLAIGYVLISSPVAAILSAVLTVFGFSYALSKSLIGIATPTTLMKIVGVFMNNDVCGVPIIPRQNIDERSQPLQKDNEIREKMLNAIKDFHNNPLVSVLPPFQQRVLMNIQNDEYLVDAWVNITVRVMNEFGDEKLELLLQHFQQAVENAARYTAQLEEELKEDDEVNPTVVTEDEVDLEAWPSASCPPDTQDESPPVPSDSDDIDLTIN